MNNLEAYKMDGLGNDFIIFDKRKKSISLTKDQIRKIASRSYIGCDQVIFIDKDEAGDATLTFYNSDGGEISACGNGSRCAAIKINSTDNKEIEGGFSLSVGNPHIIFFVEDFNKFNLKEIGPKIENHDYFPEKCNVTLASIKNKKHVNVKVWERGVGLSKACGTAACATAVSGAVLKLTERYIDVEFQEGLLNIEWNSDNNIYMTGKVSEVKKITVNI